MSHPLCGISLDLLTEAIEMIKGKPNGIPLNPPKVPKTKAGPLLLAIRLLAEQAIANANPKGSGTFVSPFHSGDDEDEQQESGSLPAAVKDILRPFSPLFKDLSSWQSIVDACKKAKTLDPNAVKAVYKAIHKQAPARNPDVLDEFTDFVMKALSEAPTTVTARDFYVGLATLPVVVANACGVPADQVSNHITFAFGEKDVAKLSNSISDTFHVTLGTKVEWTHDDGKAYAYIPVQVANAEGKVLDGPHHISIHLPDGGTSFYLNGVHQREHQSEDWKPEGKTKFETMCLPFTKDGGYKGPVMSCDFDNTLFDFAKVKEEFDNVPDMIGDASVIVAKNLTPFGKKVATWCKLGLNIQVTTSRTHNADVEKAIKTLFPDASVSFAPQSFFRQDDAEKKRALCKKSRLPFRACLHVDDELVVCKSIPHALHITEGEMVDGQAEMPPVITIALHGSVGAGKSTLATQLAKLLAADGIRVISVSPDSGFPTKKSVDALVHGIRTNPALDKTARNGVVILWDTTGRQVSPRDRCENTFVLGEKHMTSATFIGCLASVLNRAYHPTLGAKVPETIEEAMRLMDERDENPSLTNINGMSVLHLLREFYSLFGCNTKALASLIHHMNHQLRLETPVEVDGVRWTPGVLSYKEGRQAFFAKWGRQSRKMGLLFGSTGEILVIKTGLPVGREVATPATKAAAALAGDSYTSVEDAIQQFTKGVLSDSELRELLAVLTSKADGSLIQLTKVVKQDVPLLRKMYPDNSLVQIALDHAYLVSTNGTIAASEVMWPSIVTAIAQQYGHVETDFTDGVIDAFSTLMPRLAKDCDKLMAASGLTTGTLQFEAVIADRTEWFTGKVHTELATAYPEGCFAFLGVATFRENGDLDVLPHYLATFQGPLAETGLSQPLAWDVKTNKKVHEMLEDLVLYALGLMTLEDFLAKHPPKVCVHVIQRLDVEGFVLYTIAGDRVDYGKVKTLPYYLSHAVSLAKLDQMVQLVDRAEANAPLFRLFPEMVALKKALADLDDVSSAPHAVVAALADRESLLQFVLQWCGSPDFTLDFTKMRALSSPDFNAALSFVINMATKGSKAVKSEKLQQLKDEIVDAILTTLNGGEMVPPENPRKQELWQSTVEKAKDLLLNAIAPKAGNKNQSSKTTVSLPQAVVMVYLYIKTNTVFTVRNTA